MEVGRQLDCKLAAELGRYLMSAKKTVVQNGDLEADEFSWGIGCVEMFLDSHNFRINAVVRRETVLFYEFFISIARLCDL